MTSSSQGLIHLISGFPQIMLLIPPLPSASLHLCVENSQDQQAALSCWILTQRAEEQRAESLWIRRQSNAVR